MTMKSLMAGTLASVAAVAVSGTSNVSFAQVSDTLSATITRTDSRGTITSTRSVDDILQTTPEPGRSLEFDFSGPNAITLQDTGGGISDTLTITPFTVLLTSDSPNGGPDLAETLTVALINAFSDGNPSTGPSDTLTLFGLPTAAISEPNGEPANIALTFPAQTFCLGPGENPPGVLGGCSDTLFISSFTADLRSDANMAGEPPSPAQLWTLTINATSDVAVPEPASLAILGFSLLGMGAVYRRFRK